LRQSQPGSSQFAIVERRYPPRQSAQVGTGARGSRIRGRSRDRKFHIGHYTCICTYLSEGEKSVAAVLLQRPDLIALCL